jgi:hypothetical protein
MDVAGEWAERIAGRFTLAEADFAAEVGIAYAAGGTRRKDLFPGYEVQPGAFGPGVLVASLPLILHALAQAGPVLRNLLGSGYLANTLAAASLVVALRQEHGDGPPSDEQDGHPDAPPAAESPVQALSPAAAAPPASERQALEQSFKTLRDRLAAAGFDQPRADEIAYGLLEELLSDAANAAMFIDALTAVPDEAGKRKTKARRGDR